MKKPAQSPEAILYRSHCAINTLTAARKQAISQFDADLRALRNLNQLLTSPSNSTSEMFDVGTVITPELSQLLEAPLAKYA